MAATLHAVLKLEFIGENYFAYRSKVKNGQIDPIPAMENYPKMFGPDRSRPWVARIIGLKEDASVIDHEFGSIFQRKFMNGEIDYRHASSSGARGVYLYYALPEGIYEINERITWNHVQRYFLHVIDGKKTDISREEVISLFQPKQVSPQEAIEIELPALAALQKALQYDLRHDHIRETTIAALRRFGQKSGELATLLAQKMGRDV